MARAPRGGTCPAPCAAMPDLFDELVAAEEDETSQGRDIPSQTRPPRTYRDHPCEHPGCNTWGSFGIFTQDIASSQWWCREHVPFWFLRRAG